MGQYGTKYGTVYGTEGWQYDTESDKGQALRHAGGSARYGYRHPFLFDLLVNNVYHHFLACGNKINMTKHCTKIGKFKLKA